MLRKSWRRRLPGRYGLGATLVVLAELALIAFVLGSVYQYRDATSRRGESFESVNALDALLIAMLNAETGQRGYIITGNDQFLDPYRQGVGEAEARLQDVDSHITVETNRTQLTKALDDSVHAKVDELKRVVDLRQQGDAPEAIQAIISGDGQPLMNAVRANIATIRQGEAKQLATRISDADSIGTAVAVTTIALAGVSLVVLLWLFYALRRHQQASTWEEVARAKDEFAGFVSHELRGPVAIVVGNARLLTGEEVPAADRQDAAQEIVEAGVRMQSIVGTLLNLARVESGGSLELEPVLVHRIAAGVLRLHAARFPERRTELISPEDLPPALGDRDAIEQVLVNLLSNAEKYGSPNTPITIEMAASDGVVTVTVTNDGPLLHPVEFARVFEPFFRAHATAATAEGVGLGLTVCHRLVVAQGGRMSAEARPQGGALFRFTLAAAPMEEAA